MYVLYLSLNYMKLLVIKEGAHYLGQSLQMGRHSSDFSGEHGLGLGNALQDKKNEKLKE